MKHYVSPQFILMPFLVSTDAHAICKLRSFGVYASHCISVPSIGNKVNGPKRAYTLPLIFEVLSSLIWRLGVAPVSTDQ